MHAAAQHFHATISATPTLGRRFLRAVTLPISPPISGQAVGLSAAPLTPARMPELQPREFFIQGVTLDGKTFRPSDWSERLAGALSSFKPKGFGGGNVIGAHIGYSPYCVPRVIDGIKCVIVNEALRALEPMAWDFAMNFARDNDLQVVEACLIPDPPPA